MLNQQFQDAFVSVVRFDSWRERALEIMWWSIQSGGVKQPPKVAKWLYDKVGVGMLR